MSRKNLSVILLYNPSNEVRGKLRRYFYEVKANVFVGAVSAGVRDTLWDHIVSSGTEASIIIHTNNEQRFIYKTTKVDEDYTFLDFDGVMLPSHIDKSIHLNELYAKLNPPVLLIDHIMDVGYIAEALIRSGRAHNLVKTIAKRYNLEYEELVTSICFLCAVHDIGKAHPYFLANLYSKATDEKIIELNDTLKEKGVIGEPHKNFRHERFSRDIIKAYFRNRGISGLDQFADILAFHHQGKLETDFSESVKTPNDDWAKIHSLIINLVEQQWSFSSKLTAIEDGLNGVLYSILSILVTADWIASGSQWRELINTHQELSRREIANKFIRDNELKSIPLDEKFKNLTWDSVFSFPKNELQTKVIEVAKSKPQLLIIEYPCGGGKTEAALAAARLMGSDKSGIYIATPTMSTAKSMTDRMNKLAKDIHLNLIIPEFDSSRIWSDDDMFDIPKYLWTSKSRHKMLYPFAVGTVDQILKTVLFYRYACIGLMGLSDKVLIIDEVHAYDSYMLTELKRLLQWCRFLEVPVILLSATLPSITKEQLLLAAGCSKNNLIKTDNYPLITSYKDDAVTLTPVACEGRSFPINIIETDDVDHTFDILMQKKNIGCTAFVRETVDAAWRSYLHNFDNSTVLFQGRDTIEHKEKKTLDLINKLGKIRDQRPQNLKLVATSIIEQSLDIDLDSMVTCIAPIDLLIQRFGRVQRHSDIGTVRENKIIEDPITIVVPTSNQYPRIYDREIIKRTIDIIKDKKTIHTVSDVRFLIDSVYDSLAVIDRLSSIIKAGSHLLDSPFRNDMLTNKNIQYAKFKPIESVTRETTYETMNIGIIEKPLTEPTYEDLRRLMRSNIVPVAKYRLDSLTAIPMSVDDKLFKDIIFYKKDDLQNEGIELTEDGLKWKIN